MIGLFDVTQTVTVARDFGAFMATTFTQAGLGDYTSDAVAQIIGDIVIGVNVVGLVLAITLAVPRLRAHRIAFWIPLTVGIGCFVLTSVLTIAAAVVDPAFTAHLNG